MDYLGNHYYNLKNAIIKAERRILKIIITYLQILGLETNVALARKAWNFMNDSLRTDVFVRFSPEIVACSCIFLAARNCKVSLPLRPPWWELFDATFDDIEDIALSILRLYSRPRRKITHLEAIVNKLKKAQQQDSTKTSTDTPNAPHGSFTPSHVPSTAQPPVAINNNNTSKPSSKTNSPVDKIPEKRLVSSVIAAPRRPASDDRKADKDERHRRGKSESDESSEYSSASEAELPTKKYAKQRKQFENKKRRSPSTESDNERRAVPSKIRRSVSPVENHRKLKSRESRNRVRDGKDNNGQYTKYDTYSKSKRRSRSRSPVKRNKSISPTYRKEKYMKEKVRSKNRSSDKYDKHPKYRR